MGPLRQLVKALVHGADHRIRWVLTVQYGLKNQSIGQDHGDVFDRMYRDVGSILE